MNNKTISDESYASDMFGSVLKPNDLSYDQLIEDGILKITSNIKDNNFMICVNFVIKYLTKITNIKDFIYFQSSFSSDEKNLSYNTNLDLNPFKDLISKNPNKFKLSDTQIKNSIVFYGTSKTTDEFEPKHIGFSVNLFGEVWIISKFGATEVYLHRSLTVPDFYGVPYKYLNVTDDNFYSYMKRIELLLEEQINKFKL